MRQKFDLLRLSKVNNDILKFNKYFYHLRYMINVTCSVVQSFRFTLKESNADEILLIQSKCFTIAHYYYELFSSMGNNFEWFVNNRRGIYRSNKRDKGRMEYTKNVLIDRDDKDPCMDAISISLNMNEKPNNKEKKIYDIFHTRKNNLKTNYEKCLSELKLLLSIVNNYGFQFELNENSTDNIIESVYLANENVEAITNVEDIVSLKKFGNQFNLDSIADFIYREECFQLNEIEYLDNPSEFSNFNFFDSNCTTQNFEIFCYEYFTFLQNLKINENSCHIVDEKNNLYFDRERINQLINNCNIQKLNTSALAHQDNNNSAIEIYNNETVRNEINENLCSNYTNSVSILESERNEISSQLVIGNSLSPGLNSAAHSLVCMKENMIDSSNTNHNEISNDEFLPETFDEIANDDFMQDIAFAEIKISSLQTIQTELSSIVRKASKEIESVEISKNQIRSLVYSSLEYFSTEHLFATGANSNQKDNGFCVFTWVLSTRDILLNYVCRNIETNDLDLKMKHNVFTKIHGWFDTIIGRLNNLIWNSYKNRVSICITRSLANIEDSLLNNLFMKLKSRIDDVISTLDITMFAEIIKLRLRQSTSNRLGKKCYHKIVNEVNEKMRLDLLNFQNLNLNAEIRNDDVVDKDPERISKRSLEQINGEEKSKRLCLSRSISNSSSSVKSSSSVCRSYRRKYAITTPHKNIKSNLNQFSMSSTKKHLLTPIKRVVADIESACDEVLQLSDEEDESIMDKLFTNVMSIFNSNNSDEFLDKSVSYDTNSNILNHNGNLNQQLPELLYTTSDEIKLIGFSQDKSLALYFTIKDIEILEIFCDEIDNMGKICTSDEDFKKCIESYLCNNTVSNICNDLRYRIFLKVQDIEEKANWTKQDNLSLLRLLYQINNLSLKNISAVELQSIFDSRDFDLSKFEEKQNLIDFIENKMKNYRLLIEHYRKDFINGSTSDVSDFINYCISNNYYQNNKLFQYKEFYEKEKQINNCLDFFIWSEKFKEYLKNNMDSNLEDSFPVDLQFKDEWIIFFQDKLHYCDIFTEPRSLLTKDDIADFYHLLSVNGGDDIEEFCLDYMFQLSTPLSYLQYSTVLQSNGYYIIKKNISQDNEFVNYCFVYTLDEEDDISIQSKFDEAIADISEKIRIKCCISKSKTYSKLANDLKKVKTLKSKCLEIENMVKEKDEIINEIEKEKNEIVKEKDEIVRRHNQLLNVMRQAIYGKKSAQEIKKIFESNSFDLPAASTKNVNYHCKLNIKENLTEKINSNPIVRDYNKEILEQKDKFKLVIWKIRVVKVDPKRLVCDKKNEISIYENIDHHDFDPAKYLHLTESDNQIITDAKSVYTWNKNECINPNNIKMVEFHHDRDFDFLKVITKLIRIDGSSKLNLWLCDFCVDCFLVLIELLDDHLNRNNSRKKNYYLLSIRSHQIRSSNNNSGLEFTTESLSKYFKRIEKDDCNVIFLPININNQHWALFVINLKGKVVQYYDSYADEIEGNYYFERLKNVISEKFKIDCKIDHMYKHSIQKDGFNCGVYVCLAVYCISFGIDPESFLSEDRINSDDLMNYRKKILSSILYGRL